MTLYSVVVPSPDQSDLLGDLKPGNQWIDIDAKVCGVDGSDVVAHPDWWDVQMPDDTLGEVEYNHRTPELLGPGADLSPGQCVRGWVSFQIPKGATPKTIIWTATPQRDSATLRWRVDG